MQALDNIAARYRYDGAQHVLRLDSLHYGQSQLQAEAQLHAKTLALSAQLEASLRNLVPDTPFAMQARFTATGSLAGGDAAQLALQLDARQQGMWRPPRPRASRRRPPSIPGARSPRSRWTCSWPT